MRWVALAAFVFICLSAGSAGSAATRPAIPEWYRALEKPSWTPPDAAFAPVWTTLFVLMGVAAWRVWDRSGFREAGLALAVFFVQLGLNVGWSVVFFALRRPDWAVAEIACLWLAIVATIVLFARHDRVAAWLLAPYLAWVSYAAALNVAIWRMNG